MRQYLYSRVLRPLSTLLNENQSALFSKLKTFQTNTKLKVTSNEINTYFAMSAGKTTPYGAWKSPITSRLATESSVTFQEIHVDKHEASHDVVYWTEMRYDEGGRYVVCSKEGNQEAVEWTPKDFNARTTVHEYGGGAAFVHAGVLYFSNFKDQRLYKQTAPGSEPVAISPADYEWRYADGAVCDVSGFIYCVREDHSRVKAGLDKEPTNTVAMINPTTQKQYVIESGCDFYASPRVSPDGKKIAWIQWNHPNMPWDTTELVCAEMDSSGEFVISGSAKKVASGNENSIIYPRWTPDNQLLFISDDTDWWNLYMHGSNGAETNLLPRSEEIGGPQWTFGNYPYDIDMQGSKNIVTTFKKVLGLLNIESGSYKSFDTGYTSHNCVQMSRDAKSVYCIAGSPTKFSCVIRVSVASEQVTVLRESKAVPVDEGYLSVPETISWETANGETSHGYLYLPKNKDFTAPEGTLPALLVKCHGGPTSCASNVLNLKIQYFTSRGMAVLDTDYRGSTGYGKVYRHRLRKNWGICDVEDASSGARHLASVGRVDADKLCIDGGSAGGYTTLACLAFTDVFKVGASHYGIGDLEALAKDTHKFESRYPDTLIAPYTEENKHIYIERSPIHHIDRFNCPIAFFQGDEDKIVPPNQAEMMFNAVKKKGIPCAYVLFEGEQHGFRKAENVQKALDGEFYFFAKIFDVEPADKTGELPIHNL